MMKNKQTREGERRNTKENKHEKQEQTNKDEHK